MPKIRAPFTPEQVLALNGFQRWGRMHPFTCVKHSDVPLKAETNGWRCYEPDCEYRQDWAHDFMAKAKFCTDDAPCPADSPACEYWIHVDAKDVDPEADGDKIPFHCPHCGRTFDVEL